MNNRDLLSICARNLLRRRTRTLLAVVGVVVGTCAIIVMLSIGFGLSASFQEQIESYGNLHLVNVYSNGGGNMGGNNPAGDKNYGKLNDKNIAAIDKIPEVDAVSPVISEYLTFGIGKYIMQADVMGIYPNVMEKFGYELQEGRLLTAGDKNVVVFGNQVPSWFYNPKKTAYAGWGGDAQVDVLTDKLIITGDMSYGQKRQNSNSGGQEEKIKYTEYKAKGVGVLANPNDDSAWNVFMSFDALKKIQDDLKRARKENVTSNQSNEYNRAMVYVGDINDVEEVSEYIRETLGLQTSSLNDWLKSMQDTARMIQGILGGIGAISLLVAALGIANTMIMSIYERTKEIGVMKVIGANLPDIRKMFLLEAAMIGGIGGFLGVGISFLISLAMNTVLLPFMQMALGAMGGGGSVVSIIPWWVAAGGFVFAIFIGVVSGYYPARRAMNLSALESLKNE
ncbi:ABC transporter permease [Bacilliculturomica massiliensis]|uniref:ABC transporter permease n=1 Tax=Bacilliculturomica massiliensis TaxID=1917867 RepID=UPI00103090B0|nr:ABC transporter permease [Bacilliculturomica massiliensis]